MKIYKDPELNMTMFDSNIHLTELSSITPDNAQDNMARSMFRNGAKSVNATGMSIIQKRQ